MNGFDSLREHCVAIVIIIVFLPGHIGQHNGIIDLGIFFFQVSQCTADNGIKLPLVANIEHIHTVIYNQIYKYLLQFGLNRIRTLSVSKKCAYRHNHRPFCASYSPIVTQTARIVQQNCLMPCHRMHDHYNYILFAIIRDNIFNRKSLDNCVREIRFTIWHSEYSYICNIRRGDFIETPSSALLHLIVVENVD